ncbi:MAG: ABC transporter permease [Vicinamibacterales bacterium]
MDRLFQDLRIASRTLARHPGFSLVAVLTLALGIGATTALFSVVYGVLLRPLPYADADRLVTIGQVTKGSGQPAVDGSVSHLNYLDWKAQARSIASMAIWARSRFIVTNLGDADVVDAAVVSTDFFRTFRASPVMGRAFTDEEDRANGPLAIVVSHAFWQERLGGRADVLSQVVEISGRPRPIVGVAPPGFDFPAGARLWMPLANDDENCGRACDYTNGIARLADGATLADAGAELTSIAAALETAYPDANANVGVDVTSLTDRLVGDVRLALFVLLGAVGLVLLIACANVANLVLVRGAARQSELAVRTALGAGGRGLIAYLLTENLLLAALGGAAGLALAAWGVDGLRWLAPVEVPRVEAIALDGPAFLFAFGLVALTTLLFGLGPSLRLSRVPLARALGQRGTVAGGGGAGRKGLLAAEVGLSLVLLVGAGLMLRSLAAQQRIDPGWRSDGITTFLVALPAARYPDDRVVATFDRLDESLAALPGVERVARIAGLPLGPGENVLNFTRTDRPVPEPGLVPNALYRVVDPDYFDTLAIRVTRGRGFQPGDTDRAPKVAVVSETLARTYFLGEDPIGKTIRIGMPDQVEIVGLVADVHSQQWQAPAEPELYVPHAQTGTRAMMFVVKSTRPTADVLASARAVVRGVDTRLPLVFPGSLRALEESALARPRFYLWLLALFAVLAVALAAVGLYGVVAYAVAQRTREIGVRMALGAGRREVVTHMLWQGLWPALGGIAAGLAVSAAVSRVMASLLFGVAPTDPLTFAAVASVLAAVAALACAAPALRASRVSPTEALRGE